MTTKYEEFKRLEAVETDACVEWPYAHDNRGYGRIGYGGRVFQTHRLACFRWHGAPPDPKMHAAHRCGNPACMNGQHLRWATAKENAADMIAHGTRQLGEEVPASRLTANDIRDIRRRVAGGERQARLAEEYGVHPPHIHRIVQRKAWRWLDAASGQPANQAESKAS